jgi:thiamine-monophosphate kinase
MAETIATVGEFGLIHRIEKVLREEGVLAEGVSVGLGDDAASFVPHPGYELLVTCDALVEGRHYLLDRISAQDLGRRAMAVNVSDIGAMGGRPLYALVSLGLKAETLVSHVIDMYRGFIFELSPYDAAVIGGNITKTDHAAFIDITLIGEARPDKILRRSTAKPGDAILVTGFPGQAVAGVRLLLSEGGAGITDADPLVAAYNRPVPRAKEGFEIAQRGCATAMIDTSDGFLGDLGHICEESRVGVELYRDKLPISDDLLRGAELLGVSPYELFLGDSDDYELIVTCAPEKTADVMEAVAAVGDTRAVEVGRIVEAARGMRLILPDGGEQQITPAGWDHFRIK